MRRATCSFFSAAIAIVLAMGFPGVAPSLEARARGSVPAQFHGPAFDCGATAPSEITIPPANEPGEPMEVRGRVFQADGKTPVANAMIFVYHTDAHGIYAANGDLDHPRLHACVMTDAQGRYRWHTIKPGSYPNMRIPAHFHIRIRAAGCRELEDEIQFLGDPFLRASDLAQHSHEGTFSRIRPVEKGRNGVLHVTRDFRLVPVER